MKTQLKTLGLCFFISLVVGQCKKKEADKPEPTPLPIITTSPVTSITDTSASCGGNVSSEGESLLQQVGVCWDESPNPTVLNNKTTDGAGLGAYGSSMKNLKSNTIYYARAYASNSSGTSYGNELTFKTLRKQEWQMWNNGIPLDIGSDIKSLLASYVAVGTKGIYKDNYYDQNAWTDINSGINELQSVTSLVDNDYLFAGTEKGLFRSSSEGWQKLTIGNAGSRILDVNTNINNLYIVCASTNTTEVNGIFLSTDLGDTWTNVTPVASSSWMFVVSGINNRDVVYTFNNTTNKIYRSVDKGANWNVTSKDIPSNPNILGMTCMGDFLFVFTSDGTYSTSDGNDWKKSDNAATGGMNMRSLVFYNTNSTFYACCGKRVYASNDAITWTQVGNELPEAVGPISVSSGHIYVGTLSTSGKIFKIELQ